LAPAFVASAVVVAAVGVAVVLEACFDLVFDVERPDEELPDEFNCFSSVLEDCGGDRKLVSLS